MPHIGDYASYLCQASFYFCRLSKAGANAPPNPGEPARNRELIFQFGNHLRIFVSIKEAEYSTLSLPTAI